MKCPKCGGLTTVTHTEITASNGVKRKRKCIPCGGTATTYERVAADTLNELEQRLIDAYRGLGKDKTEALWATIRMLTTLTED